MESVGIGDKRFADEFRVGEYFVVTRVHREEMSGILIEKFGGEIKIKELELGMEMKMG